MTKFLPWTTAAAERPLKRGTRLLAAALLRALGRVLDRLAHRLAATAPAPARPLAALPLLEFHAEAGAPEGALYVDGEFVGHLPGVTRL